MLGLELIVVIGAALVACRIAAQRTGIAAPVLQLGVGVLLGLIPAFGVLELPSEVVLLLFLPALLWWEAFNTSLREIRRYRRGIFLTSTILVVVTAAAVAATAHAFGMPWGPAWVLGAALAPTDATAVNVVARYLPRRQIMVLRAESLVNDGTALVVFGLAVGVVVGEEHLSLALVGWEFLVSYAGGIAAGVLSALFWVWLRRKVTDTLTACTIFFLIPFTGYLLAEFIHASGVLAAVAAGLIVSQTSPVYGSAPARRQVFATWGFATFLLNGALFVLIGIESQAALRGMEGADLAQAVGLVAAIALVLVGVRLAFLYASAYLIRLIDRRPQQRLLRVSNRSRIVSGLSGFRGAISLAIAIAVPTTISSGAPFPSRDVIVFTTFGVICVMLLPAFFLPAVIRWADLPADTEPDEELQYAKVQTSNAAVEALPRLAAELDVHADALARLQSEMREHLDFLESDPEEEGPDTIPRVRGDYDRLRLAVLAEKRAVLVMLRNERRIDDAVLRQMQYRLDIEEMRLLEDPDEED
ncbi:Na+/H+ antiporter [Glycomyces sp. NPDC048151]|uniref:Na+/H+ antiporter n=1 Tax=Glycomyces sp. NPDC048151 TaxID=3364002 RepID=UPI00371A712B